MHVVIAGATGFIGTPLVERLRGAGHRVTRLVRHGANEGDSVWDPLSARLDPGAIDGADAVVNLAGRSISQRLTTRRKAEIRASRIDGTTLLAAAIADAAKPPAVYIGGSAIGFYGDRADASLTEVDPAGTGFAAELCIDWEAAARPAAEAGTRVVAIRTGIVLSPAGGALARQLPIFRLALGGRLGDGRFWQSWISLDDEIDAICWCIDHDDVVGPVNLTAPEPVRNVEFTRALGRALHRPTVLPVPRGALRLVLGETADYLFDSARILPAALERSGFGFRHPDIDRALADIL